MLNLSLPIAWGDDGFPILPSMPAAPPITKQLQDYSAIDVFGIICRNEKTLPDGHPFRDKNHWTGKYIATNWPGAKVAENIDVVLQFFCDSNVNNIESLAGNVEWFLTRAMDVSDETMVEAIIRVRNAQTDAAKKLRMEGFGKRMFFVLFDQQLLFWSQTELDDETLLPPGPQKREGVRNPSVTKRQVALKERLGYLKIIGLITDFAPYTGPDVATNCANMKRFIETNQNQFIQRCIQKKAEQTTKLRDGILHTWDPPTMP